MLTVTDIFCGAGGSSTGMAGIPGVTVRIAANHWALAIETHNTNHPDTEHAHVDLHMEDPRNFPRTDILWASPECTKWSPASGKAAALSIEMGGDPSLFDDVPDELTATAEDEMTRSRLLMFDVLRFIEHHRYRAVIVENVVDIATQAKFSVAWKLWQAKLRGLGYQFRVVSLNSMHAAAHGLPAPQSRDRLYIVAVPVGARMPDIDAVMRPKAWCEHCEATVETSQSWKNGRTVGRYRAQYVYVCTRCWRPAEPAWLPAAAAIDWSIEGQRIGDRAKPLSPKTMARIRAGLERYGRPFTAEVAGNTFERRPGVRTWPIDDVLRTLHTTASKALLIPVEGREGKAARLASDPLRTMTTRSETGVLITLRGQNAPKLPTDTFDTFAANGNHHGLLMRNNTSRSGPGAEMVTPISEVMRTLTTAGHQSLLVPYRNGMTPRPTTETMPTITTVDPAAHLITAQDIEDCTFRMLEPSEIARGMAFPVDYRILGTRREQVKQAGNAVTPPAARDLVAAVAEALGVAA